jgi:HAD superfamily hydrolase (TIGR01509 family)
MRHVFASYQIGRIKPDREYFEFVLGEMGLLPGETVFLDDSAINVAAARELGIHACRVEGAANARRELVMLDIL